MGTATVPERFLEEATGWTSSAASTEGYQFDRDELYEGYRVGGPGRGWPPVTSGTPIC